MLRFKIEWSLFWLSLSVGFRTCSLQSLPIQDGGLDCLGQTLGLGPKAAYSCPNGAFRVKRASPYRKWQNFFPLTIVEKKLYWIIIMERECQADFLPFLSTFFRQRKAIFETVWHQLLNTFFHCISLHFIAVRGIRIGLLLIAGKGFGFWVLGLGWSPHLSPA